MTTLLLGWVNKRTNNWHNPGNVPSPSKSEDSLFCKTNKTNRMKINMITIVSMLVSITRRILHSFAQMN